MFQDVDKTIKANQQQENKVALAESAADSVIEGYLQTLREEKDNEDAGGKLCAKYFLNCGKDGLHSLNSYPCRIIYLSRSFLI